MGVTEDSTLGNFSFRVLSEDLTSTDTLPMAQTPMEISESSFGDVTWDPARTQAFVDGGLQEGMEYTVRSRIVVPTPEELDICQHYAATMAVMVRALGLPARIAVGYRSEILQEDGSYLVQTDDAHAWVEVFFPGYGWLQFEPEPISTHPYAQAGTYLNPEQERHRW